MSTAFVTVRGHMNAPHLLEVDLKNGDLCRTIEMPATNMSDVPATKGGTSGLHRVGNYLYVATWDTVNVVDAHSGAVVEQISDRHFSDLHGVYAENENTVWITSTNLDGLYIWRDGQVEPFWHAWEHKAQIEGALPADWKTPTLDADCDYRLLTKSASHFHHYHINSVWATPQYIILSFLGRRHKKAPPSLPQRIARRLGVGTEKRDFYQRGGLFVLNRSGQLIKTLWTEGLHDPGLGRDGALYYSAYFGDALVRFDLHTLQTQTLPLEMPSWESWGYLTRGVLDDGKVIWVGATQHRSWSREGWNSNSMAYLRSYGLDGKWAGGHIWLSGYAGVYALIEGQTD